ncbi:MAG TPA: uracil-DNA glycosylase [Alphaproteobacteria bacterium]
MTDCPVQAPYDCPLCPRLVDFRHENRAKFPDKFNGPVPSFGPLDCKLLIVGLAPGLKGANFSGRPFTGDYAGELLYPTLIDFGFAKGVFKARPDDGLELINCRITNAVRCVPPQNKPLPQEEKTCRQFLVGELQGLKNLKVLLTQGTIAHNAVLKAFDLKLSAYKFKHGHVHELPNGLKLVDTYHTSRYNTNTGRLTTEMFRDVIARCRTLVQ